jgi:PAS domain S-box-containing protein
MQRVISTKKHYWVAILAVTLASMLIKLLNPFLDITETPFILFFGAVAVSAWYGGFATGLLATFLSAIVSQYLFFLPANSLDADTANFLRLSLYIIQGVLFSVLCEALSAAKNRAKDNLRQLVATKELLWTAFNNVPDVFVLYDKERRIEFINETGIKTTRRQKEEIIGRKDEELWSSDVTQNYLPLLNQVIETRNPQTQECCFTLPYGETFHKVVSYIPLLDEQEEIYQILAITYDVTKQKQIQKALRENEEHLRLVVESADLGMWDYDFLHHNLFWSQRCKKIFGLAPDADINYSVFINTLHPEDREWVQQTITEMVAARNNLNLEYRVLWADGSVHWVQAIGKIYYDDSRLPIRMVGVALDITERKQVESALRFSETRFANLVANIPGVIYQFREYRDGTCEFPYISSGSIDLYELEPNTIQQNPYLMWDIIHPDDIQSFRESFSPYAGTGKLWRHEWRIITPSGLVKWVQGSARSQQELDGSVLWDGVLLCVTERKLSESRFRHIFESNMIGMNFFNHNGEITLANQAYLNLIGYTKEDLQTGRLNFKEITPPEFRQVENTAYQEILQNGVCSPYEKEYICKDGSRVPVLIGAAKSDDSHGGICFVLDLSERKQLENQLREQALILSRANRAKDEFLAILSHELLTPLNSILGFAKLLQRKNLSESSKNKALVSLERNAQNQKHLIDDLLDVSHILQDKLRLNSFTVNLENVIKDAMKKVSSKADKKNIELKFELQAFPEKNLTFGLDESMTIGLGSFETDGQYNNFTNYQPEFITGETTNNFSQTIPETDNQNLGSNSIANFGDSGVSDFPLLNSDNKAELNTRLKNQPFLVNADSYRLEQVVYNILENAVKFTPQGGEVKIKLECIESYVQIEVSDNGVGINPEFLPYVFDVFRQADSSTTRKFGGLGLGLTIVNHIVEMHGGTVQAYSLGADLGATFTIKLPRLV